MADQHKQKHFLNKPRYPGGSKAFREFISAHLRYPQAALDAGIEGPVYIEYDILDTGEVRNPRVLKGLGYGCDEEALRVVGLLRFEKVKNRGLRLKITTKTTLNFVLPGIRINYSAAGNGKNKKPEEGKQPESNGYTIQF